MYIYGPSSGDDQQRFVDWFKNIEISQDSLWLFLEDFNFMRSTENKNKPGSDVNDRMIFNEIISAQASIEIPLKGCQYT
jgi:hypothetical protein